MFVKFVYNNIHIMLVFICLIKVQVCFTLNHKTKVLSILKNNYLIGKIYNLMSLLKRAFYAILLKILCTQLYPNDIIK